MKIKTIALAALSTMALLFILSLSVGAKTSANAALGCPLGEGQQTKPKFKFVNLACSTGVLNTTVKNTSGINIPSYAVITVHGVQGDCTQTAKGPLLKGKSMPFKGCVEPVTTCKASAKWELGQD
jgi:hypothetical protein